MRCLVDESTGPAVARWLRGQGHEVLSVYEEARGLPDDNVMQRASAENRILITNDKDFGERVFRERRLHMGVVLLRLRDERAASKIETISRLLAHHAGQLTGNFIVVTEKRIRFARRP